MPTQPQDRKVGIIAAWGSFPVEVAQHAVAEGKQVYVAAMQGLADPRLDQYATELQWCGMLKLGCHMRFFARHRVQRVAFAGKLFKDQILYHGIGWIKHLPDFTCLRAVSASFVTKTQDARDDTVLGAVTKAFSKKGIEVLTISQIAPTLLAEEGVLTRRQPTKSQMRDIHFGWSVARQMGGLDIGQSITVRDQLVLGVEAIEGTDSLIERTGKLCPRGNFTLIKVAKPEQDMRFDVPTIGLQTVQRFAKAGGKVIAIEAGRTIFVERTEALKFANSRGIVIVSLTSESCESARNLDHRAAA